ncbi:MAG: 50S ribosomal protein L11 methyltransferase, partial [Coxiellaceae bacterium]|nr:50S ribosomal protein L11 methyltransferase [Coxiellaceae bacterium]
SPDHAELLSETLTELGALSVSFQDAEDEPIFQIQPGETPLWKKTKVDALFEEGTSIETIIDALKAENPDFLQLDFYSEKIEDQDWVRITQQQFHPKQYGRNLWICPAWEETNDLTGTIVKIDPGLAFGTGTHPTTSLCLDWLANNPPKNKTVIDYGCGSGILSLAALALGANIVYAVDHDPQAVISTENNAKLNAFYDPNLLKISLPESCKAERADLVIANILANPLIELAPLLIGFLNPNAELVLSGLLENEVERVADAYESLTPISTTIVDGWARMVFQNNS